MDLNSQLIKKNSSTTSGGNLINIGLSASYSGGASTCRQVSKLKMALSSRRFYPSGSVMIKYDRRKIKLFAAQEWRRSVQCDVIN